MAHEIETLITAKKYEAKIMNMVPLGIIVYMQVFMPEFLEPLYHNLIGILVMTAALAGYGGAYMLSKKIVNIKI